MTKYVHLRHVLSEYLEGELLLSERQTVERHLKICAVCRQELRVLRQTVDALQRLPRETTPTDFMDKLKIRIEQHDRKSQPVAESVSAALPLAALLRWVLGLERLLLFPFPARISLYLGIVVLGVATVLLRVSSEQTTTTQRLSTVTTPPRSEVLPQGIAGVAGEKIQTIDTTEHTPEQLFSPITSPPSPTESLTVAPALVWRVAGSEPTILRQQVKALVSQSAGAVVVQEEERLLVISLPAAELPALREELRTLAVTGLPKAEIFPNTPTAVVHIKFIRSPSVATPSTPAQLPGRS